MIIFQTSIMVNSCFSCKLVVANSITMKRVRILFFFCFGLLLNTFSQNLSGYLDYKNYFFVFDNGINYQAEYNPVKSYKVGGNAVAYVDNADNFKVFYNGKAYPLADIAPSQYSATDELVVYYRDRILSVFENGNSQRLPGWASVYTVGDSIVGFYDENSGYFKIYYNGALTNLPDGIDATNLNSFKAGDNIIAYFGIGGQFKAYYKNKVFDLGTTHVSSYDAGASTIGYVDEYSQSFKVFYDGDVAQMENIAPKSMQVGDNQIAYVDAGGSFKIFYKGSIFTISSYEPNFYRTTDNVVIWGTENVTFNVFYKGQIYQLEKNVPTNYQTDLNSVAYLDSYGYLKLFSDGETKQVSNIKVTDYVLTKNVLMYKTGLYDFHFYLKGKEY